MVFEAALALLEHVGVIVPTAVSDYGRHVVVKHLVEDHSFDEKSRNPGLIEHWMDPDQPLVGDIGTKLQRALAAPGLDLPAPSDLDVYLPSEVAFGQTIHDRPEIVMKALGP